MLILLDIIKFCETIQSDKYKNKINSLKFQWPWYSKIWYAIQRILKIYSLRIACRCNFKDLW